MHFRHVPLPASDETNSLTALGRDYRQAPVLLIKYFGCLSIEL